MKKSQCVPNLMRDRLSSVVGTFVEYKHRVVDPVVKTAQEGDASNPVSKATGGLRVDHPDSIVLIRKRSPCQRRDSRIPGGDIDIERSKILCHVLKLGLNFDQFGVTETSLVSVAVPRGKVDAVVPTVVPGKVAIEIQVNGLGRAGVCFQPECILQSIRSRRIGIAQSELTVGIGREDGSQNFPGFSDLIVKFLPTRFSRRTRFLLPVHKFSAPKHEDGGFQFLHPIHLF